MRPIGELSRSTISKHGSVSRVFPLVRCRESRGFAKASSAQNFLRLPRRHLSSSASASVSWCITSQCTSHRPESVFARYESRLIRTKTILILENCSTAASPRATILKTKQARALCSPYSTAKAGSIATAHRLKHAWLASHHRAPSSQQSKSSINSVAVAIKYQVAIHLQIAVVARLVVLQKQSARPSRARFATGLAGYQYWRLESALDFSAPLAEHHRFITTRTLTIADKPENSCTVVVWCVQRRREVPETKQSTW